MEHPAEVILRTRDHIPEKGNRYGIDVPFSTLLDPQKSGTGISVDGERGEPGG